MASLESTDVDKEVPMIVKCIGLAGSKARKVTLLTSTGISASQKKAYIKLVINNPADMKNCSEIYIRKGLAKDLAEWLVAQG